MPVGLPDASEATSPEPVPRRSALADVDDAVAGRSVDIRPRRTQSPTILWRPTEETLSAVCQLRRCPLGLAVGGGLVVSQMLTLFITPVIYPYLERLRGWRASRRALPSVPAQASVE